MTAMAPLRVACLGAGYFSQFHYDAWARIKEVTLVGATDLDLDAAVATGLTAFDNLDRMIEQTKPDILDIILPPAGHAASIRTAIAAGIPTVICQKPFCLDLAEATQIAAEAQAAGVTVVVHENFRFMPWYRAIKAVIDAGGIGTILQATFRLRPGDGQGPRAYLDRQPYFHSMPQLLIHETGVHWIDTFRYLFGDPVAVYADLRRINPVLAGEDAGFVLLDHPSGVRALFDGNRLLDHASDNQRRTMGEALIEGTDGALTLLGDGSVTMRRFGHLDTRQVLAPDRWQGFGGDCVRALQAHVVCARLNGSELENTCQDYLTVIRVRDGIYRSTETGTKIRI
ncbi:Gfo/Idh/MocA family protein [Sedimentitalea todarodis]|uniref:Gfo/Idh/MocA family oxidoreductase n=1 Tax=Sedimentitalea todarodis TaxID=1631240 RepID=A0ABU3VA86_9RHOB|nr:Gfo/Idh/MocA family oxidoreductase [Sedimentitalea todarodis]MDU9003091.1 Gfo/Idh/MocA family oxidoreductase [Sedimentitalea todarodis]